MGDIVLAMGSPLGLSSSVTNGIVSAVGRTVSEPAGASSPGAVLPQATQTSAPINPGNSGGALVDISGQVIGLPTLAAVDPQVGQGGSAAPGIGFAVASNIVRDIAGQLIANGGRVTNSHRAGLVDPSGNPQGVGVQSVAQGGPAERAGIRAGDVITSVAGQQVPDPATLSTVLATLTVGQTGRGPTRRLQPHRPGHPRRPRQLTAPSRRAPAGRYPPLPGGSTTTARSRADRVPDVQHRPGTPRG